MSAASPFSFPSTARLRTREEFQAVRKSGSTALGRYFRLSAWKSPPDGMRRIGLITSRKMGAATDRNRFRRQIREIFRLDAPRLRESVWIVVIARPGIGRVATAELREEWLRLSEKLSILRHFS